MNNIININPEVIISIEAHDKYLDETYKFVPETQRKGLQGFFNPGIKPSHYVSKYVGVYSIEKIRESYNKEKYIIEVIDNNVYVYRKPYVEITTIGGKYTQSYSTYFNTFEEAVSHQEKLSSENKISVKI